MVAIPLSPADRHAWWASMLEPAEGARFTIYVKNIAPISDAARLPGLLTAIGVSRRPRRFTLPTGQTVFGDDDLYVANYIDKRPYEPAEVRPFLAGYPGMPMMRPPDPRPCAPVPDEHPEGDYTGLAPTPAALLAAVRGGPVPAADPFGVAMTYAVARRTIDVWKAYAGRNVTQPFPWHFAGAPPMPGQAAHTRLEVVPLIRETPETRGASVSSFAYICLGCGHPDEDAEAVPAAPDAPPVLEKTTPYFLMPEVLAHECGHQILYAELGFGQQVSHTAADAALHWGTLWGDGGPWFRAFHEAFGDILSVLVSLHGPDFRRVLLDETAGDIATDNSVSDIGRISPRKTIRRICNSRRLQDLDLAGRKTEEIDYYAVSEVVSGALFDALAGLMMFRLAAADAAFAPVAAAWFTAPTGAAIAADADLHAALMARAATAPGRAAIETALIEARDDLGLILSHAIIGWRDAGGFDPARFTLADLCAALVAACGRAPLSLPNAAELVRESFAWRGITPDAAP